MALRAAAMLAMLAGVARADPAPPYELEADPDTFWGVTSIDRGLDVPIFLAGAALGFVTHESGHVITNFALDNTPTFDRIKGFGFIPFVAIDPQVSCSPTQCYRKDGTPLPLGRAGKYLISIGGFNVQHIWDEVLLTLEPDLRFRRAPFRKGLFAFNILLSVGYALTSVTGTDGYYGDASGAANVAGIPRWVFASVLMAPAVLDTYRYFRPGSKWAPWVSRGAKLGMIGISFGI